MKSGEDMLNMVYIRQFKPNTDFFQVVQIEKEAFEEDNPYDHMQLYESLSNGFFVADIGGIVAGYVVCVLTEDYEGRIFSLAVGKNFRRCGIGLKLMEKAFKEFRNNKIASVRLEVRSSNIAAQSLYRKLGFVDVGYIPRYYSDGENAIVMRRYL